MITLRGLIRRFLVILLVIVIAISMMGCGEKSCVEKQVKYYENVPITQTNAHTEQESYTYQQPSVEEICGNDFGYSLEYGDRFWLSTPVVEGEHNQVKRTAYIHNAEDRIGEFGFDILYLEDGKIVERTKNPSKTLVDAQGNKRLFLAWNTPYASGKDVKIDIIDVPQMTGAETCRRIVSYTNMTGVRDKVIETESTSYENVIKTKTVTVCN